ncbi:hypothetical protein Acr_23g0021730 [Actinidia rufa]|uniref:Uncharacterized protein n=1 Tax=Actinidia rufa TaxID=165716 RepID=A0A7J0GSN2_9ERIC|nr:hypothetical protein Acr_23g0021730 [Actinidia rufa]
MGCLGTGSDPTLFLAAKEVLRFGRSLQAMTNPDQNHHCCDQDRISSPPFLSERNPDPLILCDSSPTFDHRRSLLLPFMFSQQERRDGGGWCDCGTGVRGRCHQWWL